MVVQALPKHNPYIMNKGNLSRWLKVHGKPMMCLRCEKPVKEGDWVMVRKGGKYYHLDCWNQMMINANCNQNVK